MTAPTITAHYVATGTTCDHCRAAVTEEVTAVPGVASVDVDLAAGTVRVHGAGFDDAAVLAAIEEGGYEAVGAGACRSGCSPLPACWPRRSPRRRWPGAGSTSIP